MPERDGATHTRKEWLAALRELSIHCAGSDAHDTRDRMRDLNKLLMMAPERDLIEGARPLAPSRLETLLEIGAPESAAMAMLAQGTGYLLSRGGDGESLATVVLPGPGREMSGGGPNPALALVGALSLSLSCAAQTGRVASLQTSFRVEAAVH